MVKAKVPLQIKILVNNFIILLVIGYIAGILLHEQERIREIEMESRDIREIAKNINKVHRSITELATQGEGVLGWDDKDSRAYRSKRLNTDSLLLTLRRECVRFVRPEYAADAAGGQRDAPAAYHAELSPTGGDGQSDRPTTAYGRQKCEQTPH